jgi:hypothetical protein
VLTPRAPAALAPPATAIRAQITGRRSMSKQFLAVGDYLINPELLAYAVLEPGSTEPQNS